MSKDARQPTAQEEEDRWHAEQKRREFKNGLGKALLYGGNLVLPMGTAFCVGLALLQCGIAGYFLAYFVALYLPTFWNCVLDPTNDDWLALGNLKDGAIAVLLLGIIHGALVWEVEKVTQRERFFTDLFPMFILLECMISFGRARRNEGK
jgi:hypothetical protein